MQAYEVENTRWAFLLAPQLTGRGPASLCCNAYSLTGEYQELKAAILRRYDINEETYRQRFWGVARKENKSHQELAVRVMDLLCKWMKDYQEDVHSVLEQIATEQLLSTLPREIQIWVRERKPETVTKAGQPQVT